MLTYTPPLDDMAFVLFDVFEADAEWARMPAFGNIDKSLARAVLAEAGRLASEVMRPLYQSSDAAGPLWQDGAVSAPAGSENLPKAAGSAFPAIRPTAAKACRKCSRRCRRRCSGAATPTSISTAR